MHLALKLKSLEKEKDIRYVVHAVQLVLESAFVENEFERYISLKPNSGITELTFKVQVIPSQLIWLSALAIVLFCFFCFLCLTNFYLRFYEFNMNKHLVVDINLNVHLGLMHFRNMFRLGGTHFGIVFSEMVDYTR